MSTKKTFKYSGMIAPDSLLHSPVTGAPDGALIAPNYVDSAWGKIPQYAALIKGTFNGYDPAGDCNGYYMSNKYQVNNNCYAYGTLLCPNTFPQPGRATAGSINFWKSKDLFTPQNVARNAEMDGLVYVGTTIDEIAAFYESRKDGHFVALMFSAPESEIGGDPDANWSGDYHWARCDDNVTFASWSQKDGSDQVTNFDFAGHPITNPATANWRVNQGPIHPSPPGILPPTTDDNNEYIVTYDFFCFMFVPDTGVNIL